MIEDSSKEEAERLGVKVSISSDTLKKNEEFFQIFQIEEKHIGTEIVTIGSVDHSDDDIFNICSFAPRQIISNSLCCQNSLQLSLSVGDIVQVKGFVRYVADVIGIYATEITKIKPEDALKRGTLLEPKPVYNEDSVENIDENSDEDNQDKEPFFVEDNLNNLKFGSQTEFIAFLKKKAYDAGFQFSTTRGTKLVQAMLNYYVISTQNMVKTQI